MSVQAISGATPYVQYNADGSYKAKSGINDTVCSSSISSVVSNGNGFNFIGSANMSSTALGDRITFGTLAMTVNSASSTISLATSNTVTWDYLNAGQSFLPGLSSNLISSTNISATLIDVGTSRATCGTGLLGSIQYASDTLQICTTQGWSSLNSGTTMPVFTCPSGFALAQFKGQTLGCIQLSNAATGACPAAAACWSTYGGRLPSFPELTASIGAGSTSSSVAEWTGEASNDGTHNNCGILDGTSSGRPSVAVYNTMTERYRCFIPANGIKRLIDQASPFRDGHGAFGPGWRADCLTDSHGKPLRVVMGLLSLDGR